MYVLLYALVAGQPRKSARLHVLSEPCRLAAVDDCILTRVAVARKKSGTQSRAESLHRLVLGRAQQALRKAQSKSVPKVDCTPFS
jgi:hypothetical protein